MEVRKDARPRSASTSASASTSVSTSTSARESRKPRGRLEPRVGRRRRGHRLLVRLWPGTAGLVGLSGIAGAHGSHGHGGNPVTFAVVVGLPVVAGLAGGAIAIRRWRADHADPTGHRTGIALDSLLVVLGATFALSAVTTSSPLGVAGGAVGALAALWATSGDGAASPRSHAHLALGAISTHRVLEGVALGALYGAGTAVGLLGAAFLAGHTALETAAVGGAYAAGPRRTRAVAAVALVQAGYVVGAVAGLVGSGAVPASVRTLALAVVGGALLAVGTANASTRSQWTEPGSPDDA